VASLDEAGKGERVSVGPDDYDSPWKEAVETFLPECLAFFFPRAFAAIDWSRGHTFLDQELRQIQREAEHGRQVVDKLVQVYRTDGTSYRDPQSLRDNRPRPPPGSADPR